MTRLESIELYEKALVADPNCMAELGRTDLFFLLVFILKRDDANRDFVFDRCREVEAEPNGYIDLWSREHYKSSVITCALTIQDILNDSEKTFCIFSHTRPIAKGFLRQIKREFEDNELLKSLYPDVLYQNPHKDSPKWSEDEGITVKRKGNPKECTVEAWGLVDGQPISKHFDVLIYDDVVTDRSVTTPEMMEKTTASWELSQSLGKEGGIQRHIGTRYHFNDTYRVLMRRGACTPRIYPATKNGKPDGEPVMMSREELTDRRKRQGSYVFSCHGPHTKITMADFSHKPIYEIKKGDKVLGWEFGENGGRAKLTPSEVVYTHSRMAETVRSCMDNGDFFDHTPDHKWWTGRAPHPERRHWSPLGFKRYHQKSLCKAINIPCGQNYLNSEKLSAAMYLAGFFDADGGVSGGIGWTQDTIKNSHICEKIEYCLDLLNLPYSLHEYERENRDGMQGFYCLTGGRDTYIRFLNMTRGFLAKEQNIINRIYKNGTRNIGKGNQVKLKWQKNLGILPVYNIQTTTGNYIANGYCSKNCQYCQDPVADNAQGFKREWLRYYNKLDVNALNLYILVDPASCKGRKHDYTTMWVVGIGGDSNYYIVAIVRDRFNLTERAAKLLELHRQYRPLAVAYEHYGMQCDIEHIESEQERQTYRFKITPVGGNQLKKDGRIKWLGPLFENGQIYFPKHYYYTQLDGKEVDLVDTFVEDEFTAFPVSSHDDMLDGLARIKDPDLLTISPATSNQLAKLRELNANR